MQCSLSLSSVIVDESFGMRNALDGSLFGSVRLQEGLNDDSEGGSLILSACFSAFLTLSNMADVERPRVYEVEVLSGMKQRDFVYVKLHETCVGELRLGAGMSVDSEIQFRLNRTNFVQMHEAVDAIRTSNNLHLLFPISPAYSQSGAKSPR